MPTIISLNFYTEETDEDVLQEAVETIHRNAQESIELEETFNEKPSGYRVVSCNWMSWDL